MNTLQKKFLGCYFSNFIFLIGFSRAVVERVKQSKWAYWYYRLFNKVLVQPFYFSHQLKVSEALSLAQEQKKILQVKCICSECTGKPARGGCFYLGEAASIYEKHGPLSGVLVNKDFVVDLIEKKMEDDNIFFMTVGQGAACWFFPGDYVLCFCDKKVCLPYGYQQKIGDVEVIKKDVVRQNRYWSHLLFFLSLPFLLPPFLWYGYGRLDVKRSLPVDIFVLMLIALMAGIIISIPEMFVYLHNPQWLLNRFWFLLLPLGLWGEVGFIFGGMWFLFKKKIKAINLFQIVVRAFIIFELIQLIRFLFVFLLSGSLEFDVLNKMFWSFDIPAWSLLVIFLFFGYKKTAVKTAVLKK